MKRFGHVLRSLFLGALLCLPLLSCAASGPKGLRADDEDTVCVIDQSRAHLYENKHLDYVQFNVVGETTTKNWDADFREPLDYQETKQGHNGTTSLGQLSVRGYGLEDMGYHTPVNFFDYSAYSVYTDVSMDFTFYSKSTDTYQLFDCKDRSLEGTSLGGPIGVGAVIALRRYKNSSTWTKVAEWLGIPNGFTCQFDVDGADVLKGVYIRFVAAYQTRNLETSALIYKNYRFYDYFQRETVFLAKSGTALKIESASTPNQTHDLANASYEQRNYEGTLLLDGAHKTSHLSLGGFNDIANFTLEGEAIKAIEAESGIENPLPMYAYNGTTGLMKVHLQNRTSLLSDLYVRQEDALSSSVESTHVNGDKITPSTGPLAPFGKGSFYLQGLTRAETGYVWTTLEQQTDVVKQDATIVFPVVTAMKYVMLRAFYVTSFLGEELLIETALAYFQVFDYSGSGEEGFSKYKGIYSVEEGYNSELAAYAAGATMGDGSTTFSSFRVTKIEGNTVQYAFNENGYVTMEETTRVFSEEGKYRFKVTNDFGETTYRTIYLIDIGNDNGKSRYFSRYGTFLDQNKRVYAPDSGVPCYGPDVDFSLMASPYWPGVTVTIMRISKGGDAELLQTAEDLHQEFTGTFSELGQYRVVIDTCDPGSSGDHIRYTLSFNVVDSTNYTPTVNYDLLHSGIFSSAFASQAYLVGYKTAGAGSVYFVYPYTVDGYNQALTLAIELEYTNVVTLEEGGYRYPGEGGAFYEDKFGLYDAMKEVAKTHVESSFLDANAFAEEGEVPYRLDDIASLHLDKDLYVVKDESVFRSLVRDPVYINGYAFAQLRPYESETVFLISPSGKQIAIPYDVVVDELLNESGLYEVVEHNWCGESRYQVAYAHDGHVGFIAKMRFRNADDTFGSVVQIYEETREITAKEFYFADLSDYYDPYTYLTIRHGKEAVRLLPSELENRLVDANGTYEIVAQNRLGNTMTIRLVVAGGKGDSFLPHEEADNPLTYTRVGGI